MDGAPECAASQGGALELEPFRGRPWGPRTPSSQGTFPIDWDGNVNPGLCCFPDAFRQRKALQRRLRYVQCCVARVNCSAASKNCIARLLLIFIFLNSNYKTPAMAAAWAGVALPGATKAHTMGTTYTKLPRHLPFTRSVFWFARLQFWNALLFKNGAT